MSPSATKPKRKVFLVDDHALVREWLTTLINQQPDLEVCGEADSALAALKQIPDSHAQVAIVDISLKDSSGIELIKCLKQLHPDLIVLVLSMHEESHFAERALRAGASGYVTKREATRKVIEAIRQVLEGILYLNDSLRQTLTIKRVADRAPAGVVPVEQLSDRELEVFELLGQGQTAFQIAQKLQINAKTVHTYCARIKEKMHLDSTTELLREAFHWHDAHHAK